MLPALASIRVIIFLRLYQLFYRPFFLLSCFYPSFSSIPLIAAFLLAEADLLFVPILL